MPSEDGTDYKTEVQKYSDEELLSKERSKRRRKTGDVVGTGLTAAAAISTPGLWPAAGASAKSFLSNSSKHKVILKEISRRGLTPVKGDFSDAFLPIITSAGSMAVGRAFGGAAGQGVASMAGDLIQNVGARAMGGVPKNQRKNKALKRVLTTDVGNRTNFQASTEPVSEIVARAPEVQAQGLQTPSLYQIPENQPPPATIVYHYVPPSAEYPRGYYTPSPVQTAPQPVYQQAPVVQQQPQPMYQQAPVVQQQQPIQPPQQYQQMPPALAYQYAPAEPQYYGNPPQTTDQRGMPVPGVYRAQTFYDAPPSYQTSLQRAHTVAYR